MIQNLLDDLRTYFEAIPEKTQQEQRLLDRINKGYFPITTVHRDDLAGCGFDVREVTDDDMKCLANKMADDYCEQLFWTSMEIIASEYCDIPKFPECPMCQAKKTRFDATTQTYRCEACNQSWSDDYILVENLEETDRLPEDTGYPSTKSANSRYVPEYDYIRLLEKNSDPEHRYKPVVWPESQKYMPDEKCAADSESIRCELINDESGMSDFGPNALWVPVNKLP